MDSSTRLSRNKKEKTKNNPINKSKSATAISKILLTQPIVYLDRLKIDPVTLQPILPKITPKSKVSQSVNSTVRKPNILSKSSKTETVKEKKQRIAAIDPLQITTTENSIEPSDNIQIPILTNTIPFVDVNAPITENSVPILFDTVQNTEKKNASPVVVKTPKTVQTAKSTLRLPSKTPQVVFNTAKIGELKKTVLELAQKKSEPVVNPPKTAEKPKFLIKLKQQTTPQSIQTLKKDQNTQTVLKLPQKSVQLVVTPIKPVQNLTKTLIITPKNKVKETIAQLPPFDPKKHKIITQLPPFNPKKIKLDTPKTNLTSSIQPLKLHNVTKPTVNVEKDGNFIVEGVEKTQTVKKPSANPEKDANFVNTFQKFMAIFAPNNENNTNQIIQQNNLQEDVCINENPKSIKINDHDIIFFTPEMAQEHPDYVFESIRMKTEKGVAAPICRICLKNGFSLRKMSYVYAKFDNKTYMETIQLLYPNINLKIYFNPLICMGCVAQMELAYKFYKNIKKSEDILNSYLIHAPSKTKNNNNTIEISTEIRNSNESENKTLNKNLNNSTQPKINDTIEISNEIIINPSISSDYERLVNEAVSTPTTYLINTIDNEFSLKPKTNDLPPLIETIINDHEYTKIPPGEKLEITKPGPARYLFQRERQPKEKKIRVRKPRPKKERISLWGPGPYLCPVCGICLSKLQAMQCHIQSHKYANKIESFTCDICHKFQKDVNRRDHYMSHRSDKFKCNLCERKFANDFTLKKHMLHIHDGGRMKEYVKMCHYCGKAIKKNLFSGHLLRHRRDLWKHHCNICDRKFIYKIYLTKHMKIHQAGKWECHLCGKILKYKETLKKHLDVIHENQGESHCHLCNRSYWKADTLKTHLKMKHGIEDMKLNVPCEQQTGVSNNDAGIVENFCGEEMEIGGNDDDDNNDELEIKMDGENDDGEVVEEEEEGNQIQTAVDIISQELLTDENKFTFMLS